jgi:hypothetical protein
MLHTRSSIESLSRIIFDNCPLPVVALSSYAMPARVQDTPSAKAAYAVDYDSAAVPQNRMDKGGYNAPPPLERGTRHAPIEDGQLPKDNLRRNLASEVFDPYRSVFPQFDETYEDCGSPGGDDSRSMSQGPLKSHDVFNEPCWT